jgi:tetratricopeptide (TPR) repeat protein
VRRFRPALLAGLAVALVLTVAVLQSSVQRNLGSLTYLRAPDAGSLPPGDHARYAYWRAAAALADGDAAAALALILPEASAGDRVARHLAGWAAFRANETAIAVDLWMQNRDDRSINQAIAENTRDGAPADTYALYRALDRMDRRDAAAGYARFLAAQGAVDQALALLAGMVRDNPTAVQRSGWLQAWAEILRRADRGEEAAAVLTLLAAEPGQAGRALTELGQLYDTLGDTDAALAALHQATRQEPGYAPAYAAAAALLARTGAYGDADRWYADALARQPERGDWAVARAKARQSAGDLAGSQQFFAALVAAYPAQAGVQYEAARSLAVAEAWPVAATAIEQAVAAAPKPNAAYHRLAVTIYRALGDEMAATRHEQAGALSQ